jgi:ribosomal protein S18 acetylase RimI-like enzyme
LLAAGFGSAPTDIAERLATDQDQTLLVESDGVAVGTLRVTRSNPVGGIYGFAVDPTRQGQGIGRRVLRRVCEQLRSEGVTQIGLEVATQNERALGLYTSLGFNVVTTEDYYALAR